MTASIYQGLSTPVLARVTQCCWRLKLVGDTGIGPAVSRPPGERSAIEPVPVSPDLANGVANTRSGLDWSGHQELNLVSMHPMHVCCRNTLARKDRHLARGPGATTIGGGHAVLHGSSMTLDDSRIRTSSSPL